MQAIRGDIHVAVEYPKDPDQMTLRNAVEYYKRVIVVSNSVGTLANTELQHINQTWNFLMKRMAEREGIPQGWLSYLVGELARSETRAKELLDVEPSD